MLTEFILAAHGLMGSTYGYGETYCGDVGRPVACDSSSITASGMPLLPSVPIVALSVPANRIMRKPEWIRLKVEGGQCAWVLLADKKNERFRNDKPWDFTPKALEVLGVKPDRNWSGKVYVCDSLKDVLERKPNRPVSPTVYVADN